MLFYARTTVISHMAGTSTRLAGQYIIEFNTPYSPNRITFLEWLSAQQELVVLDPGASERRLLLGAPEGYFPKLTEGGTCQVPTELSEVVDGIFENYQRRLPNPRPTPR